MARCSGNTGIRHDHRNQRRRLYPTIRRFGAGERRDTRVAVGSGNPAGEPADRHRSSSNDVGGRRRSQRRDRDAGVVVSGSAVSRRLTVVEGATGIGWPGSGSTPVPGTDRRALVYQHFGGMVRIHQQHQHRPVRGIRSRCRCGPDIPRRPDAHSIGGAHTPRSGDTGGRRVEGQRTVAVCQRFRAFILAAGGISHRAGRRPGSGTHDNGLPSG